MKQLTFSILFIIVTAMFISAQTSQIVQAGFTIERELGETDKHSYEVNLNKGELLNFVVEQRGIDLVLRIYSAEGKLIDYVDSPNEREGDEPFKMVSLNGGRYRIEVSRLWQDTRRTTGKYLVKTVEVRQATNLEMKNARLKDELMKIVVEDNRAGSYPDALKRYFTERAVITNAFGITINVAEMIDFTTKNPPQLPEGASLEDEFNSAQMEDFGDVVALNVNRDRHYKNPQINLDQSSSQRCGYVFKRVNSEWRVISVQRTFYARERQMVKLEAKQLDAFVGVYEGSNSSETLTVTREGNEFLGNFPEKEKFRLFPETGNTFLGTFNNIAFIRDSSGTVTQAVVYYSMPDDRMTIQPKIK